MKIQEYAKIILERGWRDRAIIMLEFGLQDEESWDDNQCELVRKLISFLKSNSSNVSELAA